MRLAGLVGVCVLADVAEQADFVAGVHVAILVETGRDSGRSGSAPGAPPVVVDLPLAELCARPCPGSGRPTRRPARRSTPRARPDSRRGPQGRLRIRLTRPACPSPRPGSGSRARPRSGRRGRSRCRRRSRVAETSSSGSAAGGALRFLQDPPQLALGQLALDLAHLAGAVDRGGPLVFALLHPRRPGRAAPDLRVEAVVKHGLGHRLGRPPAPLRRRPSSGSRSAAAGCRPSGPRGPCGSS